MFFLKDRRIRKEFSWDVEENFVEVKGNRECWLNGLPASQIELMKRELGSVCQDQLVYASHKHALPFSGFAQQMLTSLQHAEGPGWTFKALSLEITSEFQAASVWWPVQINKCFSSRRKCRKEKQLNAPTQKWHSICSSFNKTNIVLPSFKGAENDDSPNVWK